MVINLYKFNVKAFFQPPPGNIWEWDGHEEHEEFVLASSAEVAKRAIKQTILKKIGEQKIRLITLEISEPELTKDEPWRAL